MSVNIDMTGDQARTQPVPPGSPLEMMTADLAKSGLLVSDIMARQIDESVRSAVKSNAMLKGYVIPYFSIYGKMTQYYRVKVFNSVPDQQTALNPGDVVKYLQLPSTPNHVYFPRNFYQVFKDVGFKICILTEGEKKAALCCKHGIPAIAFSGVDSWRNRTLILPKGAEIFNYSVKFTGIKLPVGTFDEAPLSAFAIGFDQLMDLGLQNKTTFIIAYDRDGEHGVSTGPQRAAARLGFEMRTRGYHIAQIRQLVPPKKYAPAGSEGKVTIEDILLTGGAQVLADLMAENMKKRTAFPTHPAVREYVGKMLGRGTLTRKDTQAISMAVLTELDSKGRRMYSSDSLQMYYFDNKSHHLMKVHLNVQNPQLGQESEFGRLLYRDYGISLAGDQRLVQWLGTHFAGEEPLELVSPFRILGRPRMDEDAVRYQINAGQYLKVTGETTGGIQILSNGSENTLFESRAAIGGVSTDVSGSSITAEINKQRVKPLYNQWHEVLKEIRLIQDERSDRMRQLMSYLYYMSPWLMRWRGLQLPVEIVTGEAGSGKSTLYEIRLTILTGEPRLRNAPDDLKDWNASIANSGGLHVTDNVQLVDKQLRQRMSDELCRIVTEPDPRIQMRKLYSDNDEISIKANMVFAFTSIQSPFTNPDILQRSLYLQLSKSSTENQTKQTAIFEAQFRQRQLKRFGGRVGWIAHHMLVLHQFFKLVKTDWDVSYHAKHRLINLEQGLIMMARVFGDPEKGEWIPEFLQSLTNAVISTNEWGMEGLTKFARIMRAREIDANDRRKKKGEPPITLRFGSREIAEWAESDEDFDKCRSINNSRYCAKYMDAHRYNIAHITGIVEDGTKDNRKMYKVMPIKRPEEGTGTALKGDG